MRSLYFQCKSVVSDFCRGLSLLTVDFSLSFQLDYISMNTLQTNTEKTNERRQLRDIKGNLVYHDEHDDRRVLQFQLAIRYTKWETCKFVLTLPLFMYRFHVYLGHATKISQWSAPDPTVFIPSGTRVPLWVPKYEDEPRPEPFLTS